MDDAAIRISSIIGKSFYEVLRVAKSSSNDYRHFWLSGGRGSLKSAFASIFIIRGIIEDPSAHAVCVRKFAVTLRGSVFEQMVWAINKMGLSGCFSCTASPPRITYIPTGQRIYFLGLDDPGKTKSIKTPFGYFKYAWYEEFDQFDGMEEIESANLSFMRGGDVYRYLYTFNPPESSANWVNMEFASPSKARYCHHSTYLDAPREWLGEAFMLEAENLKERNLSRYENKYLGKVTGTGGSVFRNLVVRKITDDEIKGFSNYREGIDFGWTEPFVWERLHYDRHRRTVYLTDEIYGTGILNRAAAERIKAKKHPPCRGIADSEDPKSIKDLREFGLNFTGCRKGPGSVEHGYKWLQELNAIVIDPARTPNAHREFSTCEFQKDKRGEFIDRPPQKDDHAIDAVRYALDDDLDNRTRSFIPI